MSVAPAVLVLLAAAGGPAPVFEELAAARAAVQAGDLERACQHARALAAREPELREAWEIVGACEGLAPGKSLSPETARRIAWRAPGPAAPSPGKAAFVTATAVRLRAKPGAGGEVVGEATMNTRVQVDAVSGEWAEVEAAVASPAVLGFGPDFTPQPATRSATGWVQWRYLGPAPVTKEKLLRDAATQEKQADPAEAMRFLDRARVLDPEDRAVQAELVRLAIAAHDYQTAMRFAPGLARGPAGDTEADGGPQELAPAVVFLGCRGRREASTVVDVSRMPKKPDSLPANACLAGVDPLGPCSPEDPWAGAPFGPEDACDLEYRGGQSLAECRREIAAKRRDFEARTARWEKGAADISSRLRALRELFPGPSTVRFTLAVRPRTRLFAYHLPYARWACQDGGSTYAWDKLQISTQAVEAPPATGSLTVWVDVPRPVEAIVGLVEAQDAGAARARVLAFKERAPSNNDVSSVLDAVAPRPSAALPAPLCICNGKPSMEW